MNPSAAAHQAVSPNEIYIDQTLYTGRPDNFTLRLPKEQRVYTLLDSLGLAYTRIDHDPTETIESCHEVERLLDIRICKNLFLRTYGGVSRYHPGFCQRPRPDE